MCIRDRLEPVEGLLERVALLENTIYTTKKVFTFQEACMYIGVSESMLYKLTSVSYTHLIGNRGYLCGGYRGKDQREKDCWEYNIDNDWWTQCKDMPDEDVYKRQPDIRYLSSNA